MRRWSLVLICLLTAPLAAQQRQRDSVPLPDPKSWATEAEGFGLSEQDAKNNALRKIAAEMAALLARQTPPMKTWRPTIDYVKRHVVLNEGHRGEDVALQEGSAKSWIYPLKPLDLRQIRMLDYNKLVEDNGDEDDGVHA